VTLSTNVELVRAIFAAWELGDLRSAEWADPEIEFVIVGGPSPSRWTGIANMAEGFRDVVSAWEDYRVEAEAYRELDDERVLVLTRNRGRGKTSGLDLDRLLTDKANIFHLRGGKVTRFVLYWDRARALADLGIEE
jgi:ketosteroid isomerase-like protein